MKVTRGDRLTGEFQKEISAVISNKLKNVYPELSTIISVTSADIAPDLKSAKIYISVFDTDREKSKKSFDIICENAGFIRHELAKVMRIRTVPELRFHLDGSMEYGTKIDKILNGLEAEDNDE